MSKMQAAIFFCFDGRLYMSKLAKLFEALGYPEGSYDHISLGGSAKDFLSPDPGAVEHMFRQIEIALKLHHIEEVVLFHHDTCGAYSIPDLAAEEKIQISDLEKIHGLINERYPNLAVKSLIIKGTAEGDLRAEEVAFSVAA